ncbi:DNA-directed DNA polymerase [Bertholletia excelsa]
MAKRNEAAEGTRRRKGTQTERKNQNLGVKNKNGKSSTNNGCGTPRTKDEQEALVVPDLGSDSENQDNDENEVVRESNGEEDDESEADEGAKRSDIPNKRSSKVQNSDESDNDDEVGEKRDISKNKNKKKNSKKNSQKNNERGASLCFPTNRISKIMKSGDPDIRITQEAVFLVNKASEKFLQLFCKEAYACAFVDRKNHIEYKHLTSVVSKHRRFDFLSDFVPDKVRAEDALAELASAMSSADNGGSVKFEN